MKVKSYGFSKYVAVHQKIEELLEDVCVNFVGLTVQLFANLGLNMPQSEDCLCVPASSCFGFIMCIVHIVFL